MCPLLPSCLPLAACQILRIISFTVTQLPAPNYHCRLGRETAVREMPEHWWGHVVVDVGRQVRGCVPRVGSLLPCSLRGCAWSPPLPAAPAAQGWQAGVQPPPDVEAAVPTAFSAGSLPGLPPCCLAQATHGCGDLIFSSHTTFVLTGVLTFTEYGETLLIKVRASGLVEGRAPGSRRCAR